MDLEYCTYCGKVEDYVKVLIIGKKANICNECVELCSNIIHEREDIKSN